MATNTIEHNRNRTRNNDRHDRRRSFRKYQDNGRFRTVVGTTGLKNIGGRIREEYLTAIQSWNTEVKLYLEMRDDPIVGAQLDAIKLPLQAASFDVQPAPGGGPNDEKAAEWLWDNIQNMRDQEWNSHVEDALECLDFGWSLGEIVLDKRADGRIWLSSIEPRGQETLYKWVYDDNIRDKLISFDQLDPNTGAHHDIPINKCLHFKFRGRKGNPQGHSILRALFRPYRFARNLEDLEGIGIERDVGGMPVAKLKEGGYEDNDITTLKAALKGLRKDEEVYLIEPEGVDIRAYAGGSKIYDTNVVIDRWHKIMLMRFFSQFLILGMGNVGTQALVRGSQDFFSLALEAVQRYLLSAWNRKLVPYIFSFNSWTGLSGYPVITWEKPGRVDLNGLITALNTAKTAGLFTPSDIDEDHLRSIADLPELPEEERGQPRDVEAPPMAGLFDLPEKVDDLGRKVERLGTLQPASSIEDLQSRFDRFDRRVDSIERELELAGAR